MVGVRSRLFALAVSTVALAGLGALPAYSAVPRALPADDAALTLTPTSAGTTMFGGVGAGLVVVPPYQVAGGSGQVTWSYQGLPPGLAASPSSGVIGGTPSLSGSYSVTLTVSDSDGQTQTGTLTYLIDPIGLEAHSGLLPYAVAITKDAVSSAPVIATGDTEGLVWSTTGLPPGLTVDPGTGTVYGRPRSVGAYTPRFFVTNVAGDTASMTVLFEVVAAYTCNYQEHGHVGRSLSINCGVFWSPNPNEGGRWLALPGHLSYASKNLPAGLRINSTTGIVTGAPRKAGTSGFSVTVSARPDGILVTDETKWTSVVRCAIGG